MRRSRPVTSWQRSEHGAGRSDAHVLRAAHVYLQEHDAHYLAVDADLDVRRRFKGLPSRVLGYGLLLCEPPQFLLVCIIPTPNAVC